MEWVELKPIKDALVGLQGIDGLSTEQRKRLTIAVELVANPSIIFIDEPTSGLDATTASMCVAQFMLASSKTGDLVEFNITTQLPIKLNSSNYPVWFEQVDSLLIAVILLVMSLVTHLALPKPLVLVSLQHLTQTIPYGSAKINYFTSRATWLALQQAFSNRSRSPIMSLKDRLNSVSKNNMSIRFVLINLIAKAVWIARSMYRANKKMFQALAPFSPTPSPSKFLT
ncbi:hypothetical protein JHK87_050138 [Glycine soja]|nr:hypothetical protein JHK87_050138 [Glycine soja]